MPVFEYRAVTAAGKNVKGILDAPSPSDARARLHALADYLGNKYGLTIVWTGEDTATVSGSYLVVTISGTIKGWLMKA